MLALCFACAHETRDHHLFIIIPPPINTATQLTMVITDEIPQLEPVSDDSAASSTSDFGSYSSPLNPNPECKVPSDVPAHVLGGALRRDSLGSLDSSGKKKVTFGVIECRRYPVQLGDHPECSMGPPVSSRIFSSEMILHGKPFSHRSPHVHRLQLAGIPSKYLLFQ